MERRETLAVEDVVLALRGTSMVSQDYLSDDSYEDDTETVGTKSKRCSLASLIMFPDNNIRRIWTALVVFLLGYIGTVFLYRLIFIRFYAAASEEVEETDVWIAFDGIVDVMFIVDLWIQFFFTYTSEKGREVGSPRKIACRYLTGWFWVNAISCVPENAASMVFAFFAGEESLEANSSQKTVRLVRMQRMTKIVRMLRLAKLTQLTERLNLDTYIQRYKVVAVLNTLFGLIWVVHVMACGWYLCATLHEDPQETWLARRFVGVHEEMLLQGDPFDQWAHSMYFIFSVFTTVGFGDISAFTTGEIMYVTLTMMVGAVVHSIIIGQVINEVTSDSTVNAFLKNKLKLAKEFAAHAHLDAAGSKALYFWLEQNVRDLMGQQYKMDEMLQLIANDMPLHLMKDLHARLFGGQLARSRFLRVPFVSSMPPRLPMLLSLALVSKQYEGNQLLFQAGDAAYHLYLILSGTFAFVARPEKHSKSPKANDMWPYQLFSHGSYFGNYELHTHTKQFRRSTARCETPEGGQVLRLQKDHYQRLCGDFPQFASAWRYEANRRESHRCWLHANHTRMLTYRLLAARKIQRQFRRSYPRKAEKVKDEAVKKDSSGFLVPGESRGRTSLRSTCSSADVTDGAGSLSLCSISHQTSDSSAGRKPLLSPLGAGPLTASLEDESSRQQRLLADVATLRSEVETQGEALASLRREMAQLPFLVAAALKGELLPPADTAGASGTRRRL